MPSLTELLVELIKKPLSTKEEAQSNSRALKKVFEVSKILGANERLADGQIDFAIQVPISFQNNKFTVNLLQLAAYHGNQTAVELLVDEAKMDVNEICDGITATILATAIYTPQRRKAETNLLSTCPETDEERMLFSRQQNMFNFLLNKGANLQFITASAVFVKAKTVLEIALFTGNYLLVRFLLQRGALKILNNFSTSRGEGSYEEISLPTNVHTIRFLNIVPSIVDRSRFKKMMLAAIAFHQAYTVLNSPCDVIIYLNCALKYDAQYTFDYLQKIAIDSLSSDERLQSSEYYKPDFLRAALNNILTLENSKFFSNLNQEEMYSFYQLIQSLTFNIPYSKQEQEIITIVNKLKIILLNSIKLQLSIVMQGSEYHKMLLNMQNTLEPALANTSIQQRVEKFNLDMEDFIEKMNAKLTEFSEISKKINDDGLEVDNNNMKLKNKLLEFFSKLIALDEEMQQSNEQVDYQLSDALWDFKNILKEAHSSEQGDTSAEEAHSSGDEAVNDEEEQEEEEEISSDETPPSGRPSSVSATFFSKPAAAVDSSSTASVQGREEKSTASLSYP